MLYFSKTTGDHAGLINAWGSFLASAHWPVLIKEVAPRIGCNGAVYELPNYLNRPDESFAIVDMRCLGISEPHYHVEVEVYFILQGACIVILGGTEHSLFAGDHLVIPSNIAHFVVPEPDCVLAAINTPPFNMDHYIVVNKTDPAVKFDYDQFIRLKSKQASC